MTLLRRRAVRFHAEANANIKGRMAPTRRDEGFSLPLVLAFILALSLILSIAVEAVSRGQALTISIEEEAALARALDAAEAYGVYLYVTHRPVPGGVDLRRGAATTNEVLGLASDAENDDEDGEPQSALWAADGGLVRIAQGDIDAYIRYRDATGLISLNSSRQEILTATLETFGVSRDDARKLTARLGDFQDEDTVRRPLGAERADYRLRALPAPSDSPLRDLSEITKVLGWRELEFLDELSSLEVSTIAPTLPQPRLRFASDTVREIATKAGVTEADTADPLTQAAYLSELPVARARFQIVAMHRSSGRSRVRLVEYERKASALLKPATRRLVADKSLRETPKEPPGLEDAPVYSLP